MRHIWGYEFAKRPKTGGINTPVANINRSTGLLEALRGMAFLRFFTFSALLPRDPSREPALDPRERVEEFQSQPNMLAMMTAMPMMISAMNAEIKNLFSFVMYHLLSVPLRHLRHGIGDTRLHPRVVLSQLERVRLDRERKAIKNRS